MQRLTTLVLALSATLAFAAPAWAGSSEQKAALRQGAAWAAKQIEQDLAKAPKVEALGAEMKIGVIVRPEGELREVLYKPLSNAIAGLEGVTEVWPKDDIETFVDMVFLHPREPRYDEASILELGGTFANAQALLIVHYQLSEDEEGATTVDVDLSLWNGKTAEKLWGADSSATYDMRLLGAIDAAIDAGKIDDALESIAANRDDHPQWEDDFERLEQKAEMLKSHATTLSRIQADVDQSRLDEALLKIAALYEADDGALRDALWGLLTDVRMQILAPAKAELQAGNIAEAEAAIAAVQKKYKGDAHLAKMLGPVKRMLNTMKAKSAADAEAKATAARDRIDEKIASYREGAKAEKDEDRTQLIILIAAAFLLFLLILSISMKKRRRVARRNRGLDELESEASQAERVKEVLTKDADVRAAMLRELDRAEDALAEAHVKAQSADKGEAAEEIHAASQQLQELRRRVKLAPSGDAADFLKGRLPKTNLEALVAYMPAVAGQMKELSKEAMATQDAIAAGGNPSKNLKLLSGLCLQVQGKLSEREGFFRTMS